MWLAKVKEEDGAMAIASAIRSGPGGFALWW
jgi:hypothetical protein